MRNMKKFLALVLATLMVFSMAVISTSAADEADYTEAAHHLAALGVLKGDGKDLLLGNGVTRWQAALFFVQALTGKTDAKLWNADKSVYFSDVPEYGTAIDYAYGMNLIVGRGDGTYGYHDAITYQDMLVLAVRALGYETPDMVYPQGYINAATKLGLTKNIAVDVSFKDALTRGETSQIIWDMLGTEVAYTDPLSGKLVYPGDEGLLEVLLEKEIERTTLLKESGFADAEIVATIVEFTEADEDDDESVATVKVAYGEESVVLDAADLGITEDTPKVNYLGKEVTLYVDCAVADFEEKYADDKAKVVFADFNEYTTVENLGDEGNIKVVLKNNNHNDENTYVSLDGVKFKNSKYYVTLKTWQVEENNGTYTVGWDALTAEDGQLWSNIFGSFVYEDGEYVGANGASDLSQNAQAFNTYGKVEYRVTDTLVNENGEVYDKDVDTVKKVLVEVLYTPYTFGQYNVFTTKDSTTSKDADFAAYTVGFGTTNRLFGSNTVITKNTASVSATNGAAAKSVVMAGEAVESGDFMFYSYNECDNILTVAQNCGTFKTGRLTGANDKKDTVKISGTNYKFGFKGLFSATNLSYIDGMADAYLAALEAGKDNVKYLAVDGRIVSLGTPDASTASSVGTFDYVIATTEAAVVADLLEMDVEDYNEALVSGVYVEDGYVVIAVLDTVTGEWNLGYLDTLALTYDAEKEKFTNTADVASLATFADIGVLAPEKAPLFESAVAALNTRVFALVSEEDDVYKLGVATTYGIVAPEVVDEAPEAPVAEKPADLAEGADQPTIDAYNLAMAAYEAYVAYVAYTDYLADVAAYDAAIAAVDFYAPFATATNTNGITFSTAGRTNALNIPGTDDVNTDAYDPSTTRITTGTGSVVVVVTADGKVAVRAGKTATTADFDYTVKAAANENTLLSVSEELIVLVSDKNAASALALPVDEWSNVGNASVTTVFYLALPGTEVEFDYNEDDVKEYTISGLWDVKEGKLADLVTTDADLVAHIGTVGNMLKLGSNGKLGRFTDYNASYGSYINTFMKIWALGNKSPIFIMLSNSANKSFTFADAETVELVDGSTNKWNGMWTTALNGYGLNLNMSTVDPEEYDFDRMILKDSITTDVDALYAAYAQYAEYGVDIIEVGKNVGGVMQYAVTFPLEAEGVHKFSEPTEGVLNQFMIDYHGATLLVPSVDAESDMDYSDAAEVVIDNPIMAYGETGGSKRVDLKMTVVNMIVDAD